MEQDPHRTTTPEHDADTILSTPAYLRPASRFRARLAAFLIVLGLFSVASIVAFSVRERQQLRQSTEDAVVNMRDMLVALVSSNLAQVSGSIRQILRPLEDGTLRGAPERAALMGILSQAMGHDRVSTVLFVTVDGQVYAVDRSGRPWTPPPGFSAALAHTVGDSQRVLGDALFLESEHDWVMPVMMRSASAPGVTAGALVPRSALLLPGTRLQRGQEGFSVYRTDGMVYQREPNGPQYIGTLQPDTASVAAVREHRLEGVHAMAATPEGLMITGAYAKLPDYPLIIATGKAQDLYLTPWREHLAINLVLVSLFLGALALGWRVLIRLVDQLSDSHDFFREFFEDVSAAVLILDEQGATIGENNEARRLFGVEQHGLKGQGLVSFVAAPEAVRSEASARLKRALADARNGKKVALDMPLRRLTGEPVQCHLTLSGVSFRGRRVLFCSVRDTTAENRYLRLQEHLATHDPLTGTLNREGFVRALDEQLGGPERPAAHLLIIDLKDFKRVNDSLGHAAGDTILATASRRLNEALAWLTPVIGRLGGDELGVLVGGERSEAELRELALAVATTIREPIALEGINIEQGCAIGISSYPMHATVSRHLLRCADVALYAAKESVTGIEIYRRAFDEFSTDSLALRADLAAAVRAGELRLAYQPQLRLSDGKLIAAEVLCRWQHPTRGFIAPNLFIPLAEATGLIHPLSRWVIREALEQLARWQHDGLDLRIAINVSAMNLQDPDFVGFLRGAIASAGVAPTQLELEITETAIMRSSSLAASRLRDLRSLGIAVAIDDYGVGSSSLSYITLFPITSIKLDRSFVGAIGGSPRTRAVVQATIDMARNIGASCVAEGIEDAATSAQLTAMGCHSGQGYYFARPMFEVEFRSWTIARNLGGAERDSAAAANF